MSLAALARQIRHANDAGRSIEDALAGLCFVWMLTCLLDGAFLVMGQAAYVFGPIKHTSALTAWPAPINVSLYLILCSGLRNLPDDVPHIADECTAPPGRPVLI
jgi:hypothetical protein